MVTREQLVSLLYRYAQTQNMDVSEKADLGDYADAEQVSAYAREAMAWAIGNGIVEGVDAATLAPKGTATRAQAAAMIGRTQAKGYALADLTFTDSGKIPGYADYYIRTMAAQGVINGYSDGSFKPHSNITRGQMAKILYNLM